MGKAITSLELSRLLYEAGLVPERTRRIIIDIQLDVPVKVFYETYAGESIKQIDLASIIADGFEIADCEQLKPKDN